MNIYIVFHGNDNGYTSIKFFQTSTKIKNSWYGLGMRKVISGVDLKILENLGIKFDPHNKSEYLSISLIDSIPIFEFENEE